MRELYTKTDVEISFGSTSTADVDFLSIQGLQCPLCSLHIRHRL